MRITWPVAQISVTSFSIVQFSYAEENSQQLLFGDKIRKTLDEWKNNSVLAKPLTTSTRLCSTVSQLFSRTAAHIFVSPGDALATMQHVPWMERQFNACQTPRSMYLSIFNSFRVIRCLSQFVSPKIAIFTIFSFPLGTPLGHANHAKCYMDGKRIRCLQIVSLNVPI